MFALRRVLPDRWIRDDTGHADGHVLMLYIVLQNSVCTTESSTRSVNPWRYRTCWWTRVNVILYYRTVFALRRVLPDRWIRDDTGHADGRMLMLYMVLQNSVCTTDSSTRSVNPWWYRICWWTHVNVIYCITEQCLHYGEFYPIGESVTIPDMLMDTC